LVLDCELELQSLGSGERTPFRNGGAVATRILSAAVVLAGGVAVDEPTALHHVQRPGERRAVPVDGGYGPICLR
jgi:hypothetical protein